MNESGVYLKNRKDLSEEAIRRSEEANIAVFGDGPVAQFLGINFVCLEYRTKLIGTAMLSESEKSDILCQLYKNDPKIPQVEKTKVGAMKNILQRIPGSDPKLVGSHKIKVCEEVVKSFCMDLEDALDVSDVTDCSIFVDATNDMESKYDLKTFCEKNNKMFVSVAADKTRFKFGQKFAADKPADLKNVDLIFTDFDGLDQEGPTSQLAAAICAAGIKKSIEFPNLKLTRWNTYDANSERRFSNFKLKTLLGENKECELFDENLDDVVVLIGGAGGIFAGVGPAIATRFKNAEVHVIDYDQIELTNLNRQFSYYERLGDFKVDVSVERLSFVNPDINFIGHNRKIGDGILEEIMSEYGKPNIILDCLDNAKPRKLLSDLSISKNIPIMSGSTDRDAGTIYFYKKGMKSIDSYRGLTEGAKNNESDGPQGLCGKCPPNQAVGSAMVLEFDALLKKIPAVAQLSNLDYSYEFTPFNSDIEDL